MDVTVQQLKEYVFTNNVDNLKIFLEQYINNGNDVDVQDNEGNTLLMFASKFSNTESSIDCVKLLLEYGANPNLREKHGQTALILAAQFSNRTSTEKTVELLLQYGADPDSQDEERTAPGKHRFTVRPQH